MLRIGKHITKLLQQDKIKSTTIIWAKTDSSVAQHIQNVYRSHLKRNYNLLLIDDDDDDDDELRMGG